MLTIHVKNQTITIEQPIIASDTIDYIAVKVIFDTDDWENTSVWVHFQKDDESYSLLLDGDHEIKADKHLSLSDGRWLVYLHGTQQQDGAVTKRITTIREFVYVQKSGMYGDEPLSPIPASEAEQILAIAENALNTANQAIQNAEDARPYAESAADSAEKAKEASDNAIRIVNDASAAESERIASENTRKQNEIERQNAEIVRNDNEDRRQETLVRYENVIASTEQATQNANESASFANAATASANAAADACREIAAGINSMADDTTNKVYSIGIDNGIVYLKELS